MSRKNRKGFGDESDSERESITGVNPYASQQEPLYTEISEDLDTPGYSVGSDEGDEPESPSILDLETVHPTNQSPVARNETKLPR